MNEKLHFEACEPRKLMAADMVNAMDEACECPEDTPEPCGASVFTDDVIIGAAGDDELSGGGGSDTIVGHVGDDTITVGGNDGKAFTTTVDGGSGNNTLIIDYPEVSSLDDFVSRTVDAEGACTLVDANGGTINFKNINMLTVGGTIYSRDIINNDGLW